MDTVKVAKDYFLSSQSSLLIPNREYGSRKLIQVSGLPKTPINLPDLPRPSVPLRSSSEARGKGKFLPYSHSDSNLLHFRNKPGPERSSLDSQKPSGEIMKSSTKQWLHPPESLLKGQIMYNVKFLGECSVDQPKGTDVVKAAVRKMKFNKHIRRSEGQKPPKVQLAISADGVGIQDPKSKMILHQYPLHRISYCADDKSDKKMFTFIAKAATTNDHYCYVFNCSDKSAEEITLTVGQAFDLAYKRFLEEGNNGAGAGGEMDHKKQCLLLQRRVNSLQFENDALKKRVAELEKLKDRSDLEEYMKNNRIASLTSVTLSLRDTSDDDETDETSDDFEPPKEPAQHSMVGRRLENLIFDSDAPQTNGNSESSPQSPAPLLSPPPPSTRHHRNLVTAGSNPGQSSPLTAAQPVRQQSLGEFSANPFSSPGPAGAAGSDPFGMGSFNPSNDAPFPPAGAQFPPSNTNGAAFGGSTQQELMDIQAGFSRGLSFGTDDFNLDDLDPLSQRL